MTTTQKSRFNTDTAYRIVYALYASIRTNIVPKPGTLTLSSDGVLTIVDTTDGSIVLQKPIREFKAIRTRGLYAASSAPQILLYAGLNEAYQVTFAADDQISSDGIATYEKMLQGDKAGAIEALKAANSAAANDRTAWKTAVRQQIVDSRAFLDAAKEAGVYRSAMTSIPFITSMAITALIIIVIAVALTTRHS
jgi:hypothetical protein